MRSMFGRPVILTTAVTLAAVGLSLAACSESPVQPRGRAQDVVSVEVRGTDSVTVLRAGGLYNLVVKHDCLAANALGTLGQSQSIGDPGTALLMNNGGGANPCGCAATVTPPTRLPGWTCTLKTWYCPPGQGATCYYTCTPPTTGQIAS